MAYKDRADAERQRRRVRAYRARHPDRIRARNAAYYERERNDPKRREKLRSRWARAARRRREKLLALQAERKAETTFEGELRETLGMSVLTIRQMTQPEFIFVYRGRRRVDASLAEYENRKRWEA